MSQGSQKPSIQRYHHLIGNLMLNINSQSNPCHKDESNHTPKTNNSTPQLHARIPETIRSGKNNLGHIPLGQEDAEAYIHSNYWNKFNSPDSSINTLNTETKLEKRIPLSANISWKGDLKSFTPFRSTITGHFRNIRAGYLFNPKIQTFYEEYGDNAVGH